MQVVSVTNSGYFCLRPRRYFVTDRPGRRRGFAPRFQEYRLTRRHTDVTREPDQGFHLIEIVVHEDADHVYPVPAVGAVFVKELQGPHGALPGALAPALGVVPGRMVIVNGDGISWRPARSMSRATVSSAYQPFVMRMGKWLAALRAVITS